MTNEIKAKVFAQYLGQIITTDSRFRPNGKESVGETGKAKLTGDMLADIENRTFPFEPKLILKPLSAITSEDAIEAIKLQGADIDYDNINDWDIDGIKNGFTELFLNYKKGSNVSGKEYIIAYQYLQSKGYDLPHYLLDGKTLQESGLAIYE